MSNDNSRPAQVSDQELADAMAELDGNPALRAKLHVETDDELRRENQRLRDLIAELQRKANT